MSGNTVMHTKTTLREQFKFSTLTQEVVKRLEKLGQKMTNSEHRAVYMRKVMIAGIEKYDAKQKRSLLDVMHEGEEDWNVIWRVEQIAI